MSLPAPARLMLPTPVFVVRLPKSLSSVIWSTRRSVPLRSVIVSELVASTPVAAVTEKVSEPLS